MKLRNTFIAAETTIGRGLLVFVFWFWKEEIFIIKKNNSSKLYRNTGFYTILKENLGGFFNVEKLLKLGS